MNNIFIIGAAGQIGSELTYTLRQLYGDDKVVAGVRDTLPSDELVHSGPSEDIDVLDVKRLAEIVKKYNIDVIVNMAALLSATGEANPMKAWDVNVNGLINVLEVAREFKVKQVVVPSSIAVFGPSAPADNTPQETITKPTTIYGITKFAGELLGDYYVKKYGMDIRGLRYPGIISHATAPGGGTTDYAVAIFYDAVKSGKYNCFLEANSRLPMMYMPDCLKATIDLMHADFSKLRFHSDYNVGAMSFTPEELAVCIKKYIPKFEITYEPDSRQAIADSWPNSVDDSDARKDWDWKPDYDIDSMSRNMIEVIGKKLGKV